MKKGSIIGIVAVVVVVLVAGGVALSMHKKNTKPAMPTDMNMSSSSSSSSGTNTNTSTTPAAADKVSIKDFAFGPASITVKKGTTVTWTNQDSVSHTVTSDDGSAEKIDSPFISNGSTFSHTFNAAGTFAYHCQPHPYMKGTVVVTE